MSPLFLFFLLVTLRSEKMVASLTQSSDKTGIGRAKDFLLEHYLILANVILLAVMMFLFREPMLSRETRLSLFTTSTMLGILTIGQAIVIVSGGIDLSNGALVGLTSILAAWMALNYGLPYILVGTFVVCVVIGLVSGLLVTRANFPPLIATLVALGLATGLAFSLTGGAPIVLKNDLLTEFGRAEMGGLPYYSFVWFGTIAIAYVVLIVTPFGRHLYSLGGSEKATYVSGVNTSRVKIGAYLTSALLAWVGGIIYSCFTASGVPIAGGFKYMLDSISATVIGGISLSGGKGNILDASLGAFFFALLYLTVIFLNISPLLEEAFRGILLLAVVFYAFVREKKQH